MEKQIYPFYCKFRDKTGKEQRVGVEISEGYKKLTDSYAGQEGRVITRFFSTTMAKETQIRYTMEPAEAFEIYMRMMKVYRSPVARDDAVSALTTTKNHPNSRPQAVGLLRQLHAMITGPAPVGR